MKLKLFDESELDTELTASEFHEQLTKMPYRLHIMSHMVWVDKNPNLGYKYMLEFEESSSKSKLKNVLKYYVGKKNWMIDDTPEYDVIWSRKINDIIGEPSI